MISQRRAVQLGVIAATAVFSTCIGILVFQGGDTADDVQAAKVQQVDTQAAAPSSNTLTLSSARTPVVHLQTAQR